MIAIKVDIPDLEKAGKNLSREIMLDQVMARLAFGQMARIKLRTAEGKDVNEKAFVPYSPSWSAFREESGRPTGHVDLFFSGKMMAAMDVETRLGEARIFFNDALQGAKAHGHTHGIDAESASRRKIKVPQREFFAVSESDEEAIIEDFQDELQEALTTFWR